MVAVLLIAELDVRQLSERPLALGQKIVPIPGRRGRAGYGPFECAI